MTPIQYVRAFARSWWLIVICAIVGLGVSEYVDASVPPLYTATASVLVSSASAVPSEAVQATALAQQRIPSYADLASGSALANTLVDELDLSYTPSELQDRIKVMVPAQSTVIRITVDDTDPERTRVIAARAAEGTATMIGRLEKSRGQGASLLRVRAISNAPAPATAIAPAPWRNPALGLAGGLAIGLALAVVRARLDRRVRDESAARETLGAPILGVVPTPRWRPAGLAQGYDAKRRKKAVRELRTSIYFLHPGTDGCLTLAITSARPIERLPQIAGDVAAALVDAGARVLLVQADLHLSVQTPLLEADDQPGLGDYLVGDSNEEAVIHHHDASGVDVVPAGSSPTNPADLLHSEALATLLQKAAQHYDFVLVTTAATSFGTDAAAVAARCDGALVAVARRVTTRRAVRAAVTQLERVDAPVLGGVYLS